MANCISRKGIDSNRIHIVVLMEIPDTAVEDFQAKSTVHHGAKVQNIGYSACFGTRMSIVMVKANRIHTPMAAVMPTARDCEACAA